MKASIPIAGGETKEFDLRPGTSVVFVGANGAGKTRLGVRLEKDIGQAGRAAHRIAAHRSLSFNDSIEMISYDRAEALLRYGHAQGSSESQKTDRWGNNPATKFLSDFDHVLRTLYAEQHDVAVAHLNTHRANPSTQPPTTKLLLLREIWQRLLPNRALVIQGANIKVSRPGETTNYLASSLSDGERVIFYLIGQALLVKRGAVLIVDEPELHIHKSILADLWDEIEGHRRDLTFIYTTHDLDFATSRHAALKFALTDYSHQGAGVSEHWTLTQIQETAGLPEQVVSLILGSRRGIAFVEGEQESLDSVIYRRVYPERTIRPIGGHDQVIHSVASFSAHPQLHRIAATGLIDCDDHTNQEIRAHAAKNVFVIPVSEIENLLMLPMVFYAIARSLSYSSAEARLKTEAISQIVLQWASRDIERFSCDYARRRIDRAMKTIGLTSNDPASLAVEFEKASRSIDVQRLVEQARTKLEDRISRRDIYGVLQLYDNKGLVAEAAKLLNQNKNGLEEYLSRLLANKTGKIVLRVLRHLLPKLPAA